MRLAAALGTAAFLLLTLPSVPARAAATRHAEPPIAVMPFKNLNDDPSLEWLSSGIAETMITDLKRAGGVKVVERDQIDKLFGEVMLQQATAGEDQQAVMVGKLTGAKTIVLGSFQQAGKEIRLNARFVSVETGEVLDTAKATGPSAKIFSLQDEVVDRLLGKAPAARPRRKASKKTFEAYRLYAMAVTTASDANRVEYLKASLALDPDFVYARDDLESLKKRLEEYAKAHTTAVSAADGKRWAAIADPAGSPGDRTIAANQYLIELVNARRYHALVREAQRIAALEIPAPSPTTDSAAAFATFESVLAWQKLGKPDLALQAGELYLKTWPAGVYFSSVSQQVKSILDTKAVQEEGQKRLAARFAELDAKRAKLLADAQRTHREASPARLRDLDLERCWFPRNLTVQLPARAVEECDAFLAKYAKEPGAAPDLDRALYEKIQALGEIGRFDQAVPQARAFIDAHPVTPNEQSATGSEVRQLQMLLDYSWPTDASSS